MDARHLELADLLERLADFVERLDPVAIRRSVADATSELAGVTSERIVDVVAVATDLARRYGLLSAFLGPTPTDTTDPDGPMTERSS